MPNSASLSTPSTPSHQARSPTGKPGFGSWMVATILASSILAAFAAADPPALIPASGGVGGSHWPPSGWTKQPNAEPQCAWSTGFDRGGIDGWVFALAVFDDGNGPALYAAGQFDAAGTVEANNIARWDGSTWSTLSGPDGEGVSGSVYALAVHDDGSGPALYAGGSLGRAGGIPASRVARWDGKSWSALSDAIIDDSVRSLEVFDSGDGPELYAGGAFETVGGVEVNHIARWNGSTWSNLKGPTATGLNSGVLALEVFDDGDGPDLYAGGFFTSAGGAPASKIARWDGSAWSTLTGPMGEGTDSHVYALSTYDRGSGASLYVGGGFRNAGGVAANRIARWDGAGWSAVGGGRGGDVYVLSTYHGGGFPELCAGAADFGKISCWTGAAWRSLSGPAGSGVNRIVSALAEYDDGEGPALFVGGTFDVAGGLPSHSIARWRAAEWSAPGGLGMGLDEKAVAFAPFRDSRGSALYVGGTFEVAGTEVVHNIARWDGASWSPVGDGSSPGTDRRVSDVIVFDDGAGPALYAAGDFRQAGGMPADRIARWDGTSWSAISGPNWSSDKIITLEVYDDGTGNALYAGGWFDTIDGIVMNNIARWDGVVWTALTGPFGTGTQFRVFDLATFDDGTGPALYVTGQFLYAGGIEVNYVARWDGATWSPLHGPSGTGVDRAGSALAVYDDGDGPRLYLGGFFDAAGGRTVNHVARWDGVSWEALTGPYGTGTDGLIREFVVYNDGSGPALYAGGFFATAGGLPIRSIARWDGKDWFALDTGVWDVTALEAWNGPFGPELYVGGNFNVAGHVASSNVAAWACRQGEVLTDGFESSGVSSRPAGVP